MFPPLFSCEQTNCPINQNLSVRDMKLLFFFSLRKFETKAYFPICPRVAFFQILYCVGADNVMTLAHILFS